MPGNKYTDIDVAKEYPPYAVGMDPVTGSMETTAQLAEILGPDEPIKRDPYFGNPITDSQRPAPRRSDFSVTTWAMIVAAGIVLGAAIALMAAGA